MITRKNKRGKITGRTTEKKGRRKVMERFGILIISVLLFYTVNSEAAFYQVDTLDDLQYWDLNADDNVVYSSSIVEGFENKAVRINYNFDKGNWVDLAQDWSFLNINRIDSIRFLIRTAGQANNLEIKLDDTDGTVYGVMIENVSTVTSWHSLVIPRDRFKYWWGNDQKLDNIKKVHIAVSRGQGGNGSLMIDNLVIEGDVTENISAGKKIVEKNKVIIDDFEMPNPYSRYFILQDEDSSLTIERSMLAMEGTYGLEYNYTLSSSKIRGTWVLAQLRPYATLNWTDAEGLSLWVKGDNSQNTFIIALVDSDNETWVYEDRDILSSSDWKKIIIKLSDFKLAKWSVRANSVLDKGNINIINLMVANNMSGTYSGTIYLDEFSVFGEKLTKLAGAIHKPDDLANIKKAFTVNGTMKGYFQAKDQKTYVHQELWLQLNTELDKIGVTGEVHFVNKDFGNAANGLTTDTIPLESSVMQLKLSHLYSPLIEKFVFGSLRFDQSLYIFSKLNQYYRSTSENGTSDGWGFKGVQLEGKSLYFPYTAYWLVHKNNSYSLFGELSQNSSLGNLKVGNSYIRYKDEGAESPQLNFYDNAFISEGDITFLDIFRISGTYGFNEYDTVQTNSPKVYANMYILNFSMLLDLSWLLKFEYEYHNIDTRFKPFYRQMRDYKWYWTDEYYFDEYYSDSILNRFHTTISLPQINLSVLVDNLKRKSDKKYYKKYIAMNLSYQLWRLTLEFIIENERNYYLYQYPQSPKYLTALNETSYLSDIAHNEKYTSYEFKVSSRFTQDLYLNTGFRIADYVLMGEDNRFGFDPDFDADKFSEMGFMINLEYLLTKNIKTKFETKHFKLAAPMMFFEKYGYNHEYFVRLEISF